MCLRRATCLSYSPFRRCRIWVLHLNWIQKGAKITCPAFGLYSSPFEKSTMGHIPLDLTTLAYQPKSREPSSRLAKYVTFALSQRKSAYPARVQKLDDDEDDKPLVRSDCTTVSHEEDEDDKPLVQPPSARKRGSSAIRRVPTPLRRRNGPPVWWDPFATLEQDVSGTSKERSQDVSSLGKKTDSEALLKIINQLLDVRNLKDFHLKHYHMSSAQFKKRTTHLDNLGKVHDLYQHVVKTCPFAFRQFDALDFLLFWMVLLRIWPHVHVRVPLHPKSFPSFMSGLTHFRWIRRRFVQIWLSIILMTCRYSIECTIWGDFLLDHTLRGEIELKWVFDCSKGSSRHSWTQPPRIWTRLLCHRLHLLSWRAKQRRWETHR